MKEGSWAYLKQKLCPADKWLRDSEQTKCHCCNKEFKFLVRRRHHCRSCGKIFCSSCSNYWINGKYIDASLDSRLRLCEYCHKKILEYGKDIGRRNYEQNSQTVAEKPTTNSDEEEQQEDETYTVYNEMPPELSVQKQFLDQFNLHIAKQMQVVAEYLCDNNDVEARWASELATMVLKATIDTKIDTLYANLLMDITHYVKIKRVQTRQEGVTRAFRGYAATKNVANKHMQSDFQNPRVLVITPSVEMSSLQSDSIKFEQIVSQEKSYLKKIIDKLLKFNPHLVFVENTINIVALEYLQSKGVTVVSKLKPKVVDNIKRVTKMRKKIEKLYYISKLLPDQVVGTCKRIYFQRFEHETESKTIMFLEDEQSPVASIILADPDHDKLTCLKKITRRMLKTCRQMFLQKYLIEADVCYFNKSRGEAVGYFDDFLDKEFEGAEQFLRKKSISLSKLNFVKCHFSNIPDIGKQVPMDHYFKALPYSREWSFKEESDLCFQPEYKTRKFYSKDPTMDIPLGCYLVQKVANIDRKCTSCGRPKYNHNSVFYYDRCMVRVQVEEIPTLNFIGSAIIGMLLEEQNEQQPPPNLVITKQKLQMQLRDKIKSTLSPKEVITSFFECEDCRMKFCEPIELKRAYLENSFLFFLYKLSMTVKKGTNNQPPPEEEGKCNHPRRCRVFKHNNTLVKFIVQPLKVYQLNEISLLEPQSKAYLEELERQFLESIVLREMRPVHKACESLMNHLNSLSSMYGGDMTPKRQNRHFEYLAKLKDLLSRILKEMEDLVKREQTKLKVDLDYTSVTQQCHNYYVCFEFLLKIAIELDAKMRKNTSRREQSSSPPHIIEEEVNFNEVNDAVSTTLSVLPDINLKHADLLNVLNDLPERLKEMRWAVEEATEFAHVPVFREDPISFIAFALNSKSFAFQKDTGNQIIVKVTMTGQSISEGTLRKSVEELMQGLKIENKPKDYKEYIYQVTVFHHTEFEKIRTDQGICFKDFLRAILGCASWDNTGGKSGSKFAKSYNEMIVMKFINDKQFEEFKKFVSSYIEYVREAKMTRKDSMLAKIFGIFQVNMRGKIHNCVVMQNIFFRLNMKKVIVYDLKGSEANRFAAPKQGKGFTGLDTNFKVDRNSEPMSLPAHIHDRVLSTLQNDCNFLSKQEVIDYSLLLIINQEDAVVRMGIIDFMRPYHIFQKIENFYKEMKLSATPTVIPPKLYSERFMQAMKHYFLRISSD